MGKTLIDIKKDERRHNKIKVKRFLYSVAPSSLSYIYLVMGAQVFVAKNTVDTIVKAGISAATVFSQTCSNNISNAQEADIRNCTINATAFNITNVGYGINKCVTDVSNKQNLLNNVEQAVHQATEAAKQQLGLLDTGQVSVGVAINTTKAELDIATTITDTYSSGCSGTIASTQTLRCDNSTLNINGPINLQNYQVSINECALRATQQTSAYNELKQIFSQSAVAKEESIFSIYVVVGLVSIAIIAIIIVNIRSTQTNAYGVRTSRTGGAATWIAVGVVVVIGLLVIGYAYLASSNGWWPFKSTKPSATGYRVE